MEFTYTAEDFLTSKPYEYLLQIQDAFRKESETQRLALYAAKLGVKGFKKALAAFKESKKQRALGSGENISDMENSLELNTGNWMANENGVFRYGARMEVDIACPHPIYPVERLKNIDTGELKVRLAYRRGGQKEKREILVDFDTVSNSKNITALAKIGVSVTSGKRAQNLVDYLCDVMDLNYDEIPEKKSVSRLGWNEEGFAPYIGDIEFDGNEQYLRTFKSVTQRGSFAKWTAAAKAARAYSLSARIVLAASFASVLVEPLGCLPFFVHLWGMDSGTGKSVAQMLAASVWAEPTIGGEYVKTMRSTSVGFEVMAGFLHSLPLILDEAQLARNEKGKIIFNVYELASGAGKMRSTKTLGLAATPKWANCFITSGETPITSENDGSGAMNRVIEIECTANTKVVENGREMAAALKSNYGHAGRFFIEKLCEPGSLDEAKRRYNEIFEVYQRSSSTEKQSHSAALITLADELITGWLFCDGNEVKTGELAEMLRPAQSVSAALRGYEYLCGWVAQNANKLRGQPVNGEVLGLIAQGGDEHEGYVYILRNAFNKACLDGGINAMAILGYLSANNLIARRKNSRAYTKSKRIDNVRAECVVLRMPDPDDDFTLLDGATEVKSIELPY